MVEESSTVVKQISVQVPAYLGLSSKTILIQLDGDRTLLQTTLDRHFPGARALTYKSYLDHKIHSVYFDYTKLSFMLPPVAEVVDDTYLVYVNRFITSDVPRLFTLYWCSFCLGWTGGDMPCFAGICLFRVRQR
uniref:TAR DNA-binding protein 43 N-terminal domain-containing protein n=1 Tax=Meloidogyne javanica TaxID=6303 RepID=A0A915M3L7_MELJA